MSSSVRFTRVRPELILAGVLGLCTSTARAQSVDGRFQLGLHTTFLSHDSATLQGDDAKMSFSTTSSGLAGGSLGVQLGYGVSDRWLVGGRLGVGSTTQTITVDGALGNVETAGAHYLLTPRIAYVLSDGEHFKPYVAGTIGLRGQSTSSEASSTSASAFVYGAELGAHVFASGGVSIDPSLTVLGVSGQQTFDGEETTRMDHSGYALLLGVTLSGWFGDGPPRNGAENDTAGDPDVVAAVGAEGELAREESRAAVTPNTLAFNEDGTLRLDIGLGPGRLRLIGHPAVDGSRVLVQLVPRFDRGECTDAHLLTDRSDATLTFAGQRALGQHSPDFLATAAQVRGLSESKETAILLCGARWSLGARERSYLAKFLAKFREVAMNRGTWTEPSPDTVETPPVDTEASP